MKIVNILNRLSSIPLHFTFYVHEEQRNIRVCDSKNYKQYLYILIFFIECP